LFFFWRRLGINYRPNFQWRGFGLAPALKAGSWTLAMVLVTQIAGIFQSSVASSAVEGRVHGQVASVAASAIAWLIFMLPHSVATVSLATVYFTRISVHVHEGRMADVRTDLRDGLRIVGLISILSATALITLAYPISRVFVGEYSATASLAQVLVAFMVGLLPFSIGFFMQKAFYSLEDTRTPFYVTVVQSSLYIVGALAIQQLVEPAARAAALAYLTSATVAVQAVIAFVVLRKRIGKFADGVVATFIRYAIAAVIAGVAGALALNAIGGTGIGHFAVRSVATAVLASGFVGVVILVVFVGALWAIRAPEFALLSDTVKPVLAKLTRRKG
jgi:putative peptidoglycan lipid II flippase